jgi:hypothetical protein
MNELTNRRQMNKKIMLFLIAISTLTVGCTTSDWDKIDRKTKHIKIELAFNEHAKI